LLGASSGDEIRRIFAQAEQVASSRLTTAEIARTLRRLSAEGRIDPEARERTWAAYQRAVSHFALYEVSVSVDDRLRRNALAMGLGVRP
jgi:hypothetical protein